MRFLSVRFLPVSIGTPARGVVFGRRFGQRVKSDKLAPKVLELVASKHSYRQIGRLLNLSKNTVLDIVKREREISKD